MKKLLFAFLMIGGLLKVPNVIAQSNRLYLFIDCGFASTGLGIDRQTDERYAVYSATGVELSKGTGGYSLYKNQSGCSSLGVGLRFAGGYGLEASFITESTYSGFRDSDNRNDDGWSSYSGYKIGIHQSYPVYKNLKWSFAISYCRLEVNSNDFNDIVVEPFRLEYVTSNGHVGLQFSLVSFEGMSTVTKKKEKVSPYTVSYEKSGGNAAIGLGFNSTPLRLNLYF